MKNHVRVLSRSQPAPPPQPWCSHLEAIEVLPDSSSDECPDCIAIGDTWVHLRMCLECGHVGCCDSSRNRHASAHNASTGHAVMRSIEPGEQWAWCFVDDDERDYRSET